MQGLNFKQIPMELWYLTTTMKALPRTMREPIVCRWGTIGYNMKLQMLLLRRGAFSTFIQLLHQNNTMSSGCFMAIWIFVCLLQCFAKLAPRLKSRWWIGEKDPVHQIYMQEPHCQVPSVARHALSHWLWYDIILVGQMECVSSGHFSEGCLSRTRTVYLMILVRLMLISWKLYSLLSVW